MKKNIKIIFVSVIFLFLFVWAFIIEPNMLVINRVSLDIPNWPEKLKDLKIVAIGDLHAGSPFIGEQKIEKVVKLIDAQKPDIVLLLGDYDQAALGSKFIAPEITSKILGKIKSTYGVMAVLGNHDWWLDGPRFEKAFEQAGIKVLENESIKINHNGESFWVAGLADLDTRTISFDKAFKNINDKKPILLLTHSPDVFPEVPAKVSLSLAGHTHGGQVQLPIIGPIIVPSHYGTRYASGHIVEDGKHLFVTNGVGTSILSVRFLCPPEIVVMELY